MSINLSRNTRLWVSTTSTGHTSANTFEIPIQEGYGLSQATSSSDVTVEEAGATPTRGSKRFNDTLDPVEWSFTTYSTPYLDTNHYLVDMLLWHALATKKGVVPDFAASANTVTGTGTSFDVSFADNSAHELTPLILYFMVDNVLYTVSDAQVNQAEISVDIADIAQVAWSGQAQKMTPTTAGFPAFIAGTGAVYDSTGLSGDYVAISTAKSYLVNKLTTMDLNDNDNVKSYTIPITGATITINNNISYLTPSTLAEVDAPIGSFTGTFDVSGSVDAYLRKTVGDDGSYALMADMASNMADAVTTDFALVLNVGGPTGAHIAITVPMAHLSFPEVSVDDVISTSFEFKGIPSSPDLSGGTEVSLAFFAG